jgi:hypothetical protein
VTVIVDAARLALTSTPSIGPSSTDVMRPSIAAEDWALPVGAIARATPTAIATNTAIRVFIGTSRA